MKTEQYNKSTIAPSVSYTLYYVVDDGEETHAPLKRRHFETVGRALEAASAMLNSKTHRPVEIRDRRERLVTCSLMGWKAPDFSLL